MKTFLDVVILGEGVEGGGAVGGCGDGEGEWTCVTSPARLRAPEQLWMTGAWPGCRSRSEGQGLRLHPPHQGQEGRGRQLLHGRGEEGVGGLGALLVVVVPEVVLAVLQLSAEGGQGAVRQEGGAGGGGVGLSG